MCFYSFNFKTILLFSVLQSCSYYVLTFTHIFIIFVLYFGNNNDNIRIIFRRKVVRAPILRYLTEFGSFPCALRKSG